MAGSELLITPHGDLEPQHHGDSLWQRTTSLPLMGIWNGAGTPAFVNAFASLPLMGIWNPSRCAAFAGKVVSLPLMGNLELVAVHAAVEIIGDSLPLMGIWNDQLRVRAAAKPHLITPHGDLERWKGFRRTATTKTTHYPSWGFGTRVANRSGSEVNRQLITPHGDLERSTGPKCCCGRQGSLPLMGIWNTLASGRKRKDWNFSLPLMGIWNPFRSAAARPPPPLITPHGDLEQWRQFRCSSPHDVSLPLMGIWNLADRPVSAGLSRLITPHGDLEHATPSNLCAAVHPHYPSWGFGTPAPRRPAPLPESLITPHGDLEPASGERAFRRTAGSTHYPSWGFGTPRRPPPQGATAAHYPSWGFGTLLRRHFDHPVHLAHYPSWGFGTSILTSSTGCPTVSLPLMGIWNGDHELPGLGDVQPHYPSWGFGTVSLEAGESPVVGAHYPSWGFGTRVRPSIPRTPPSHYHSWGFGTLSRSCGTRLPAGPHYPSWGFGTAGREGERGRCPGLITPHGDLEPSSTGFSPIPV